MNLKDIWAAWGPVMVTPAAIVLLTLVEITPIKINPWSAIIHFVGRRLNADVTARLDTMQQCQTETRERLDEHIAKNDAQTASLWRTQILRFNDELLHDRRHTKVRFDEMLDTVHDYETYCQTHKNFPNGKCVHAIDNINRVYDELLESHDFL